MYIYFGSKALYCIILKFAVLCFFTTLLIFPLLTAINFLEDGSVIYRNTGECA